VGTRSRRLSASISRAASASSVAPAAAPPPPKRSDGETTTRGLTRRRPSGQWPSGAPEDGPAPAIGAFYIAARALRGGDVRLSAGVNVWYGCVIRGDVARITLGPRVNLQDGCLVHTDTGQPQVIEEGVVVGHAVVLHGSRVGQGSLIGIGARLLAGC